MPDTNDYCDSDCDTPFEHKLMQELCPQCENWPNIDTTGLTYKCINCEYVYPTDTCTTHHKLEWQDSKCSKCCNPCKPCGICYCECHHE